MKYNVQFTVLYELEAETENAAIQMARAQRDAKIGANIVATNSEAWPIDEGEQINDYEE